MDKALGSEPLADPAGTGVAPAAQTCLEDSFGKSSRDYSQSPCPGGAVVSSLDTLASSLALHGQLQKWQFDEEKTLL